MDEEMEKWIRTLNPDNENSPSWLAAMAGLLVVIVVLGFMVWVLLRIR